MATGPCRAYGVVPHRATGPAVPCLWRARAWPPAQGTARGPFGRAVPPVGPCRAVPARLPCPAARCPGSWGYNSDLECSASGKAFFFYTQTRSHMHMTVGDSIAFVLIKMPSYKFYNYLFNHFSGWTHHLLPKPESSWLLPVSTGCWCSSLQRQIMEMYVKPLGHRAATGPPLCTGPCPCRATGRGGGPGMAWCLGPCRAKTTGHGPGRRAAGCMANYRRKETSLRLK